MTYTPVDLLDQYRAPDPSGGTTPDVTDTDYDLDRKVKHVALADGRAIDFLYGSDGKLTQVTTALGTATFVYNPTTGRVSSITDDDGDVLSTSYDGGLLTTNTWGGPSGHVQGSVSEGTGGGTGGTDG